MLGIVIVIYKSIEQVAAYISQELVKIQSDYRAVVVDVGCDDVDDVRLPRAFGMADGTLESGRLFLLREKENLGYARGNNLGVDYLLRRFPDIDLFLITNDDIQFISSNVVDKLIEKISSFSDVAVIGPRIVNLQDEEQLPELTPPSVGWEIRRNVLLPILGKHLKGRMQEEVKSGYVFRLEGCFMLVRKDDFLASGKFDERTFLYREEAILSERLKAIGKRMYYDDSVTIRHFS